MTRPRMLVQDTLFKAYRGFDRLEHPAAAPAWLTSILVNVCRDRRRARARAPQEVSIDALEEFSLFRKMPDLYRIPLVLVYVDGFVTKQVARMLEAPLGTVLARLHRGRKLFEKRLWEYAEETGLLREGVR